MRGRKGEESRRLLALVLPQDEQEERETRESFKGRRRKETEEIDLSIPVRRQRLLPPHREMQGLFTFCLPSPSQPKLPQTPSSSDCPSFVLWAHLRVTCLAQSEREGGRRREAGTGRGAFRPEEEENLGKKRRENGQEKCFERRET